MNDRPYPRLNERLKVYDLIDDTYKEYLWGLRFCQLERTWLAVGGDELRDVRVCLIDSGLDRDHEDLRGANVVAQYNFLDDNEDIGDRYGHGTAVAGVVAATRNNALGIAGVAGGASLLVLKVMDGDGTAAVRSMIRAIEYAIDNEADVINISMGYPRTFIDRINGNWTLLDREYHLLKCAMQKNIAVVSAVGNDGEAGMEFPASMPGVISVASYGVVREPLTVFAATTQNTDARTIYAPGVAIMTTTPGSRYQYQSGSSMAASFVTGGVALIKARYRDASPAEVYASLVENCDTVVHNNRSLKLLNVDRSFLALGK